VRGSGVEGGWLAVCCGGWKVVKILKITRDFILQAHVCVSWMVVYGVCVDKLFKKIRFWEEFVTHES